MTTEAKTERIERLGRVAREQHDRYLRGELDASEAFADLWEYTEALEEVACP